MSSSVLRKNNKKPLPKKLALNVALATALFAGYGSRNKAYAGSCTGASGVYTCSGAADNVTDTSQNFTCDSTVGQLTVTTNTGFGLDSNDSSPAALYLNTFPSDCSVTLTDLYNSNITATNASGISGNNSSATGKDTTVTTTGNITSLIRDGITFRNGGASGDLVINTNDGNISGLQTGIYARNRSTAGSSLSITSNGTISGQQGISANVGSQAQDLIINTGINSTINNTGTGVSFRNDSTIGGNSTVTINGTITSDVIGIRTSNDANSDTLLTTGQGTITGSSTGILSNNSAASTGSLSIVTGTGAVTGGNLGIRVNNSGSGSTTINATGSVTGTSSTGIYINNDTGNGSDINITTGTAPISGAFYGIRTLNRSQANASTRITTNGDINGPQRHGIYARHYSNESKDINISTSTGIVSGGYYGIKTYNKGYGEISLNTADGSIIGTSKDAIYADNKDIGANISLTSTNTTITGARNGINALNNSQANASITLSASGDVTGTQGHGIYAKNAQKNSRDISIATGPGTVHGYESGIRISNRGTGTTSINSTGDIIADFNIAVSSGAYGNTSDTNINTGNGTITGAITGIAARNFSNANSSITIETAGQINGNQGYGIWASNNTLTSKDITVTSTGGSITGESHAIRALNNGYGVINISSTDTMINSNTNIGVSASLSNLGSDINITTDNSTISAYFQGIQTIHSGLGNTNINATNSNISSLNSDGIFAQSYADINVTTLNSTISGASTGITTNNRGTGTTSIITTGDVSGISAQNYTNSSDIYINAGAGNINGNRDGINIRNTSEASSSINVITSGNITGALRAGIRATNLLYNTGGINIISGAGAIHGSTQGIGVSNNGKGLTSISTTGDVSTDGANAIEVITRYYSSDTNVTTGAGSINGGDYGILVDNNSNAGSSITVETSGPVTGSQRAGIKAFNNTTTTQDITVNTGNETITGNDFSIRTLNNGSGITAINTTGLLNGGILSSNGPNASHINIDTGSSNIVSGQYDGIKAENRSESAASISITTTGTVSSTQGAGIIANNTLVATNQIVINTGNGAITAATNGIQTRNRGAGTSSINANGPITSTNSGILAQNYGSDIEINSNANVDGGQIGIMASSTGDGNITITTAERVSGTNSAITTSTDTGSSTTININANSMIEGNIFNNDGNSNITIDANAEIMGLISLSQGSDRLTINGNGFSDTSRFFGGDDSSSNDGFVDVLAFNNTIKNIDPVAQIMNWEQIILNDASTITMIGINTVPTESFTLSADSTLTLNNGSVGDSLTILGEFISSGTLGIDASLDPQLLDTDRFIISGTTASNSLIDVTNIATESGLINPELLKVIDATDNPNAQFNLASPVVANAFEYKLVETNNSWYLQSLEVDITIDVNLTTQPPYAMGSEVVYQINVSNEGPDTAKNITIQGTPSNLDFMSLSSNTCSPNQLPCTISTLASGESQTLTYRANIDSFGTFRLNASAQVTTEIDLNPMDNIDDTDNGAVTAPQIIPSLNIWSKIFLVSLMSFAGAWFMSRTTLRKRKTP